MKILIALILAIAVDSARGASAQRSMNHGRAMFQAGDFEQAATNFGAAAAGAALEKLDPAVAQYNEAAATLKLGQPGDAARLYAEALRSPDLRLQQKAYFNRGNALAAAAHGLEEEQQLDSAVKTMGEAIGMYENAIALDPKDQDPKVNFELALKMMAALEEKLKQQQQQQQSQPQDQKSDQKKDENENQQSQQDQQSQKDEDQQQKKSDADKDKEKQEQQAGDKGQQPQPAKPEEMTKEEAALLLDAAKQQEQADREQIRLIVGRPVPVEKDW